MTGHDRSGQVRTGQDRTGQDREPQSRAGQAWRHGARRQPQALLPGSVRPPHTFARSFFSSAMSWYTWRSTSSIRFHSRSTSSPSTAPSPPKARAPPCSPSPFPPCPSDASPPASSSDDWFRCSLLLPSRFPWPLVSRAGVSPSSNELSVLSAAAPAAVAAAAAAADAFLDGVGLARASSQDSLAHRGTNRRKKKSEKKKRTPQASEKRI